VLPVEAQEGVFAATCRIAMRPGQSRQNRGGRRVRLSGTGLGGTRPHNKVRMKPKRAPGSAAGRAVDADPARETQYVTRTL
jgi:hypothetical protein